MKGVVLTGGKGSRLRPFTYSGAKQLVPIANTPVLHFPVRQLVACGITDIALVVGDTEPQIRSAMGDGSDFGARFTYVRQEAPLGIAHGLGLCRAFADRQPVVLYLGDNVLLHGIEDFVRAFEAAPSVASVVLKAVDDPRSFGVAVHEGDHLVRVVEKPALPPSNLAVIGVYAFRPDVFEVIATLRPSARGELEIADAINGLIASGRPVTASVTEDYWIDTGKMEDMLAANRAVLASLDDGCAAGPEPVESTVTGMVRIEPGATVERSRITGPVVIAAGAHVSDSDVGPDVAIGPNCTVRGATIANTIVMESSTVADCAGIVDSMIGRFVEVTRAPIGSRLVLGDHSRFEGGP
jgi:glucose-1-phosphate thymidylyltransferase